MASAGRSRPAGGPKLSTPLLPPDRAGGTRNVCQTRGGVKAGGGDKLEMPEQVPGREWKEWGHFGHLVPIGGPLRFLAVSE